MYGILEVWLNQIIAPCVVGAVISKQCPSILAFAALYTYTKSLGWSVNAEWFITVKLLRADSGTIIKSSILGLLNSEISIFASSVKEPNNLALAETLTKTSRFSIS